MNDPLHEALEEGHPGAYRCLFENDINGVAIFDAEGRLIDCNQRATELLGYDYEEALGRTPADFSPPRQPDGSSSEERSRALIEAVAAGASMRLEWLCERKTGEIFYAETALSPLEYDGRTYIQAVVADVTERKEAIREIERSEERFRALAEQSLVGTYIFRDGVFEHVNQRLAEILGYEARDQIVGKLGPLDVTHPEDVDKARSAIHEWVEGERASARYDCRIVTPDDEIRTVEVFGTRVDLDGGPAIVGILMDVTEERARQRELRRAKDRAEEASRLKSAFLANMSHEIRTPLASIIGFADVVEEEVSDSGREFVDLIRTSGQRLLETLNSVLDLARLEGGAVELDTETFDAVAATEQVVASHEEEAEGKGLDLRFDTPIETAEIRADRGVYRRILGNLIGNAVKFTREGTIDVFLQTEEDEIALHVRDTGVGIEDDELEAIFQPFHQESRGFTREYEGSGLGLTVTHKLIELLEGEIEVESEKGSGTTFAVRLPRRRDRAGREQPSLESAHQWGISMLPPNQKTLIVEDDPNMQTLVTEYLPDSYAVDTVGDARSAIDRAETERYDLVLMDINLRDSMNGVDILHRFREDSKCENALIVAITAYALPGDGESFKAEGFDGYVSKPFTRETLYERLIQVL